jgi:hypothetical protein
VSEIFAVDGVLAGCPESFRFERNDAGLIVPVGVFIEQPTEETLVPKSVSAE